MSNRVGTAAVHLRLCGATYEDISDTLGLDGPKAALSLVTRELGRNQIDIADRENLRNEESQRLLHLLRPVMTRALNERDAEHLAAARTALAIIDRRIRLLGLDAPTQIAVHTPSTAELEAWVVRMAAIEVPAVDELDVIDVEVIEDADA